MLSIPTMLTESTPCYVVQRADTLWSVHCYNCLWSILSLRWPTLTIFSTSLYPRSGIPFHLLCCNLMHTRAWHRCPSQMRAPMLFLDKQYFGETDTSTTMRLSRYKDAIIREQINNAFAIIGVQAIRWTGRLHQLSIRLLTSPPTNREISPENRLPIRNVSNSFSKVLSATLRFDRLALRPYLTCLRFRLPVFPLPFVCLAASSPSPSSIPSFPFPLQAGRRNPGGFWNRCLNIQSF